MDRRVFFKMGLAGSGAMAVARHTQALEYFPMPSDKRVAVMYSTWCGSTRDAALWINEGMNGIADVFDVRENPDLGSYDHLVIGGAIRMNATSPAMVEYLTAHQSALSSKVRGLFAVCGNQGQPVGPEQSSLYIEGHLAPLTDVITVPSAVFNGRVTKALMDPETAAMMASFEDYDNLDRARCITFGKEVLESL